jgi:hypothetical protein
MKNYNLFEESVYKKLNDPVVVVGDTITYNSSNQQGYEKYVVILENRKKQLKLIDYYGKQPSFSDSSFSSKSKSKSKSKSNKSKSNKSKSKSPYRNSGTRKRKRSNQ